MAHELRDYVVGKQIGQGAFAVVYLGTSKINNQIVAIKAVNINRLNNKLSENLAMEIQILREINHQNIVRLFDIQKTKDYIYLVMEYCPIGDLAQYLRRHKYLLEDQVKILVIQISFALKELRKHNIVHRDLKPQNLLLSKNNNDSEGSNNSFTIKVADFGFAREIGQDNMAETLCGSPLYMAPEVLDGKQYDAKADLWSVGAMMYEMLYRHPPFLASTHISLARLYKTKPPLNMPKTIRVGDKNIDIEVSDHCSCLLRQLLQINPEDRIDFEEFFNHPFLSDSNITLSSSIALTGNSNTEEQHQSSLSSSTKSTGKSMLPSDSHSNRFFDGVGSLLEDELLMRVLGGTPSSNLTCQTESYCRLAIVLIDMVARYTGNKITNVSSQHFNELLPNNLTMLEALILSGESLNNVKLSLVQNQGNSLIDWIDQKYKTIVNVLKNVNILCMEECQSSLAQMLYYFALHNGKEAAMQEITGNIGQAILLYQRSLFIFHVIMEELDLDINEQDQKIIENNVALTRGRLEGISIREE